MAVSNRALRIFSAVEALREGRPDIRFALAPLFQPDLSKFHGEIFDPSKLASEINLQYRLNVNRDIVEELMPVFVDLGWIKPVDGSRRAYIVTCETDAKVAGDTTEFDSRAVALADQFREFIRDLSPLSQVSLDDESLIDALVDWLVNLDVLTDADLKTVSKVEKVGSKLIYQVVEPDEVRSDDMAYLCARFVESAVKAKSDAAAFLVELGSVGLITDVVRDFHKPSTHVNKTDLAVYLDAPLALDYLGLSGLEAQDSIKVILDRVVAMGGSIRVFRLSIEEMQTSLGALLNRPAHDRDGATATALKRGEVLEAYIRQVANKPDPILKSNGIGIVDQSIEQFPNDHSYFDRDAIDEMYSQIGWVREDAPRFHDAAIAAMTMRKRRGARSSDIFDVKHLVVTRNPMFPSLARRMSVSRSYINNRQVGPVIHQRQLATAVWLRAGLGRPEDEAIPRKYILSACRRVLTLRKNIVQKVKQVSDSLTEEQAKQLELLLTQSRSTEVLMDKTLGSDAVIDSSNISMLVEEMKDALIEEAKKDAENRVRAIRKEAASQHAALESKIIETAQQADILAEQIRDRDQNIEAAFLGCVRRANRYIKRRRVGLILIASLAVCGAEYVAFTGGGLRGGAWWLAVGFVTVIALSLLLKESIDTKFLTPVFREIDTQALFNELEESGLPVGELMERVNYEGGKFVVLTA